MILQIIGLYHLTGIIMLGAVMLFYKKYIPEFYESMTEDVRTSSFIKAMLLIICVAALWPIWIFEDIRAIKDEIVKRSKNKDGKS